MASECNKVHQFKVHDTTLTAVTVYNDRAEIKRTLNVALVPGINEVIIQNVTKLADTESVRVDGRGPAQIHDVQFQCKPSLPEEGYSPKVEKLEEERKKLQTEKEAIEDRQKIMQRRVEVLDEIVAKVGGSVVDHPSEEHSRSFVLNDESLENLRKFFLFYEKNSAEVREKLRELNEEHRIISDKLTKVKNEIGMAQNEERFARHISVLLESADGGDVEVDISYQVWGARWYPSYDIRIEDTHSDEENNMKITYYGIIEQHTGEDWIDAPLMLSTAQPSLAGEIPELGTQIALIYKPPPPIKRKSKVVAYAMDANLSEDEEQQCMNLMSAPMGYGAVAAAPVSASDTVLSTVFVIARPATIPSDSNEHKVTITTMEMRPTMVYEAVPCKSTNVFLAASVLNSSQFPLLPGQANVYLNNSFVAKSEIKAISPNERFLCSLGVDTAVKVEYKPAHKYSEQVGLLAKSSSTAHEQRIMIKNTKNEAILLTVKEHVPKSTDEKIKIKLLSPELDLRVVSAVESYKKGELPKLGARMNAEHNLEWTINLEGNSDTELLVKWSVDHPNGETIEYREEFCERSLGH